MEKYQEVVGSELGVLHRLDIAIPLLAYFGYTDKCMLLMKQVSCIYNLITPNLTLY